jgi:hypothetical protein
MQNQKQKRQWQKKHFPTQTLNDVGRVMKLICATINKTISLTGG